MEIHSDFKELVELLNAHGVEYLIVGSVALAFHGCPRYTIDIDFFVKPDLENAKKLVSALSAFGFESLNLDPEQLAEPERILRLGIEPMRVDFMTSITGVTWAEADQGKIAGKYDEIPSYYLGRDQFIKNKRASGRIKDLGDLEVIGE